MSIESLARNFPRILLVVVVIILIVLALDFGFFTPVREYQGIVASVKPGVTVHHRGKEDQSTNIVDLTNQGTGPTRVEIDTEEKACNVGQTMTFKSNYSGVGFVDFFTRGFNNLPPVANIKCSK